MVKGVSADVSQQMFSNTAGITPMKWKEAKFTPRSHKEHIRESGSKWAHINTYEW